MNIRILILLTITSFTLISCSGPTNNKTNDPNDSIIYAKSGDPELEKVKQEALSNLEYFIKSFQSNSTDTIMQYYVKMDFIDNGEHEHMWVFVSKYENEEFFGFLANEPEIVKNVKNGQPLEVAKEFIEDWVIVDTRTGKKEGDYSTKVLLNQEK